MKTCLSSSKSGNWNLKVPKNLVNHSINKFLNKLSKKDLNFMVLKKELTIVLPYLDKLSFGLRTRLRGTIEKN